MPRRSTDKPIQVPLTPDQHEALKRLQRGLSINEYIRQLLRDDAIRQCVEWPERGEPTTSN